MKQEELKKFRNLIDEMDSKLMEILIKRASYVKEVGRRKKQSNLAEFRPEREVEIIERMCELNKKLNGNLASNSIATIWLEIISGCRSLEKRLKIAYLGPPGTYSELAARALFGHQVVFVPFDSLEEVMAAGEKEECDISLLPVENSIEGTVGRTLDLFLSTSLKISAEISIPINHLLLRNRDGMDDIKKVVAHSQALLQCQVWLNKNLPSVPKIAVESNGIAAKMASDNADIVAVAGQIAADTYKLSVLANKIENDQNNRTRFAALGNFEPDFCGVDHTSLILAVPDKAGAMHGLIEPLAKHGVSMKRFESRPARKKSEASWQYYFYLDLEGHKNTPAVKSALKEIKSQTLFYKELGSYPLFELGAACWYFGQV